MRSLKEFLRRIMNQSDNITLFIDGDQSSAYRDYILDLREVLMVKLGLTNFYTKRVSKFQGRQWPSSASNPRQDLLGKDLGVRNLTFNPLHSCAVRLVIGFGAFE